jgi:hypothetical protein
MCHRVQTLEKRIDRFKGPLVRFRHGLIHQPPNHTPTPCTTPTGGNIEAAINNGPRPLTAENTMDVSYAAYTNNPPASSANSVRRSNTPTFVRQVIAHLRRKMPTIPGNSPHIRSPVKS